MSKTKSIRDSLIQLQNEAIERLQLEIESREKMLMAEIEAREGIIKLLSEFKSKHNEVKP